MEPHERVIKVMKHYKLNKNSLSSEIGMSSNVTIGRIINEKRTPNKSTLKKIVDRFPNINYEWLLTGEGDMIKNNQTIRDINQSNIVGNNVVGNGNKVVGDITLNEYKQELDFFKKETARLSRLLEGKDEQLSKKDEQINRLLGIIEKLSK